MKNIDKIKQMNAGELARFYNYYGYGNSCSADYDENCADGIAKWLSMEHSEGDE